MEDSGRLSILLWHVTVAVRRSEMIPGPGLRAGHRRMTRPLWCPQRATNAKAYSLCLTTCLLNKSHLSPSRARWMPHGEMLWTSVICSLQVLFSSLLSPQIPTCTSLFFFKETFQFNMCVTFDLRGKAPPFWVFAHTVPLPLPFSLHAHPQLGYPLS